MNERCVPPTSTVRFSLPLISVEAAQFPVLAPVVLVPVVEPPAPPELEELLVSPPLPPAPTRPDVDEAPVVAPPALVLVTSEVVRVEVVDPSVLCEEEAWPVVVEVVVPLDALEVVVLAASPVELMVPVDDAAPPEFASLLQAMAPQARAVNASALHSAPSDLSTHPNECLRESDQRPRLLRLAS